MKEKPQSNMKPNEIVVSKDDDRILDEVWANFDLSKATHTIKLPRTKKPKKTK